MVALALSGAARAQSRDENWAWCKDTNPHFSISACTALIQSGRETATGLAVAFYNRGNAYNKNGRYDRAIADYDQAIRLDPNQAHAFRNRGAVYAAKGQYDRAIQDYDQAILLDPHDAGAFNNR